MINLRRAVLCVTVGGLLAGCAAATPSPSVSPMTPRIWELTYLKARPGEVERLATFIERNWFVMDARARAAGHMEGFRLLRSAGVDTTWDLLEISIYRDSLQHAQIDSLFATVYKPSHRTVPVDGKTFPELGAIVRTATTKWAGGMP